MTAAKRPSARRADPKRLRLERIARARALLPKPKPKAKRPSARAARAAKPAARSRSKSRAAPRRSATPAPRVPSTLAIERVKIFRVGRGAERRRVDGEGNSWPEGDPVWRVTDQTIGLRTHVRARTLRGAREEVVRRGMHALTECEPGPSFEPNPRHQPHAAPPVRGRILNEAPPRPAQRQRDLFPHEDMPLFRTPTARRAAATPWGNTLTTAQQHQGPEGHRGEFPLHTTVWEAPNGMHRETYNTWSWDDFHKLHRAMEAKGYNRVRWLEYDKQGRAVEAQ
jgi:hypothetical protein